MTRLEAVKKIAEIEIKKQAFEALLNDVSDYYCDNVFIGADLNTKAYERNKKYTNGTSIEVDKTLFKKYLEAEIEKLKIASDDIVNEVLK